MALEKCLQHVQILIGTGAEIGGGEHAVLDQASRLQRRVPGAVRGEKRNLRPEALHQGLDPAEILLVVAKGAVFIFHLHQNHGAAAGDLKVRNMPEQLPVIGLHLFQKQGSVGPHLHVRVTQQPGGKPAHFPLRADEGAGPQDHVQPHGTGQAHKSLHVPAAGEVELSFLRLVDVPGDVGLHRVKPHGL